MKQMILLLAGLGLAAPAFGAPSVAVKCAANEERVWVYNNLTTWDVSARLKCGTMVDVLGVEKGYVRVRTADGNEGYVPVNALPQSELSQIIIASAPAPAMTVAAAARANMQAGNGQPAPAPQVAQAISDNRAMAPVPAMNAVRVAEAAPAPPQPAVPAQGAPAPPSNAVPPVAPAPVPDAAPAEQNRPAPPQLPAPAQAPIPVPTPSEPARIATAKVAPQPAAVVTKSTPAPTASAVASTSTPKAAPARIAAPQPTVAMVVQTRPQVSPVQTAAPAARESATLVVETTSEPAIASAPEPTATTVKPAKYMTITRKSNPAAVRVPEFSDDDDLPTPSSTAASEDLSACSVYFSAYGVTPMQYKWIADERGKRFPGVCPAPEPSMVDYVVIFTHDMNYFTTTLPDAVHTDQNGFSDWSPVTSVDDTQIPVSLLDRARHEYAWVFRVHRGTFDPGKFTSQRRPQYTKTESRSSKSIEDAIEFMADSSTQ
jgi:hypothetical protein